MVSTLVGRKPSLKAAARMWPVRVTGTVATGGVSGPGAFTTVPLVSVGSVPSVV